MAENGKSQEDKPRQMNIGGRYGSPTITIAWPFSHVTRVDTDLREDLAELAGVVARLAAAAAPGTDPGMAGELAAVRQAADDLARRLAEQG